MADNALTVEQRLKTLYDLQALYSQIDRLRAVRGELPEEVKDIEDSIAGLNTRIDNYKQEIEELRRMTSEQNAVIQEAKLNIDRYQAQINDVRNNKEYNALSQEIEDQQLSIELADKKIGENAKAVEDRKAQIEETLLNVEDKEHTLGDKKKELEEITRESQQEIDELRGRISEMEAKFDDRDDQGKEGQMSRLLSAFKRIRRNARNGLGIVCIQREACGGCFNRIPPQMQMEIKLHKKVKVCEYCGRIMIDPVLAGVETEPSPEDEAPKPRRSTRKKAAEPANPQPASDVVETND